jgi:hypothetical protein
MTFIERPISAFFLAICVLLIAAQICCASPNFLFHGKYARGHYYRPERHVQSSAHHSSHHELSPARLAPDAPRPHAKTKAPQMRGLLISAISQIVAPVVLSVPIESERKFYFVS